MAYSTNLIKITWGGSLYQNADIWSNGVHALAPTGSEDDFASKAALAALVATPVLSDWMSSAQSLISSNAVLEWVKVAIIGTDGKYLEDSVTVDIGPVNGSYTASNIPPQISTVISLTTDANRGLAHIGRIYPPLTGFIGTNGYIDASYTANMASQAALLIQGLNNATNQAFGLSSDIVIASKVGAGVSRIVSGVRVGNVLDTQRSRRNAFTETYSFASV